MADQGYTYDQQGESSPTPPSGPYDYMGFVGLTSLNEAEDELERPAQDSPLSSGAAAAMGGSGKHLDVIVDGKFVSSMSVDGCVATSNAALSGGLDSYKADRELIARLYVGLGEASAKASSSSTVATAQKEWSACMANKGFAYASPPEVANARNPKVPLKEWKDAEADLECKATTGFLEKASAAMAAAEQAYVDAHPGIVTQWKDLMDKRYQRVRNVLDGKAP